MRREEKRNLFNLASKLRSLPSAELWKILNRKKNEMAMRLLPITAYPLPLQGLAVVSHKHKFVYYIVPKAASVSIRAFIKAIDPLCMKGLSLAEAKSTPYRNYFHFTFVRNPYDRLLSCYIDKFHEPRLGSSGFTNGELNLFLGHYGRLGCREMSFGDFIQFVTRVPYRHSNRHFTPQCYLLNLDLLNFIGHVENFDQDLLYLRKQVGVPDEIPQPQKLNASRHGPYQSYYNDKLRKMVARKYARDLEIFNYGF